MFYLVWMLLLTSPKVSGISLRRRTTIFDQVDYLAEWLVSGTTSLKGGQDAAFLFGRTHGSLRYTKYYIDVLTPARRVSGCAAIRVGGKLLLSRDYAGLPFYPALIAEARKADIPIIELPSLTTLRSTLSGDKIPTPTQWEYAIRSITTKATRRGKVGVSQLRQLQTIRDLIGAGTRPRIAEARLINAFVHQGAMTHVFVHERTDRLRRGESPYYFTKFFANAEDALTEYLSTAATANMTVLEF